MSGRICIRPRTYHGKDGFLVCAGDVGGGYGTHIFTRTREGAEIVKDALFLRAKADAAIDTILREGR